MMGAAFGMGAAMPMPQYNMAASLGNMFGTMDPRLMLQQQMQQQFQMQQFQSMHGGAPTMPTGMYQPVMPFGTGMPQYMPGIPSQVNVNHHRSNGYESSAASASEESSVGGP
jgi:hypothetical protein